MLGKPGTYKLRGVTFRNKPNLSLPISRDGAKVLLITDGAVESSFGEMPQSGRTAFCTMWAPETLESKFRYTLNGDEFEEGGMSVGDVQQVATVSALLEQKGHDAAALLEQAKRDLAAHHDALMQKVGALTAYMYPQVMAGRTKFTSAEVRRAYNGEERVA